MNGRIDIKSDKIMNERIEEETKRRMNEKITTREYFY